MSVQHSLVQTSDPVEGVRVITLDDTKRRNALSTPMVSQLVEALRSADDEGSVRVIVIRGANQVFCAGGDLAEIAVPRRPAESRAHMRNGIQRVVRTLAGVDTPVIAVIDGAAVGAGLDLALACDLRIASPRAKFSTGFVRVGLVAADGGAWLLPRVVGTAQALELLWTGDFIDAEYALRIGLVGRIVSTDQLMAKALDLAGKIGERPPVAIQLTKRLVREAATSTLGASLELAASHAAIAADTDAHTDALASNLNSR